MSTTEVRIDAAFGGYTLRQTGPVLGTEWPVISTWETLVNAPTLAHMLGKLFPGSRVSITTQENTRTSGHD